MRHIVKAVFLFVVISLFCGLAAEAQSVYELRKLTEDEWLAMSTEERLSALSTSFKHERNQTFIGQFGRDYDLYKSWGYEFYEMEDRYENYSFRNYEAYNIIEERRKRWSYNEFGDRIAKMRHSANVWHERYKGDDTYSMQKPYSYINSIGVNTGYVDGIWVAREGTDDWAVSVIGAGALRTRFTPLTLALPSVDGVSVDFQSANSSLKFITSSYMGNNNNAGAYENGTWVAGLGTNLVRRGGVMLRGGRFRRKFGALTLGATYANAYGVQGNRQRGHEWRGTVTSDTPTPIMVAVRFLDDSPEDNEGGPIVYNVRLKINGRYHDEIIPQIFKDDVTRDRTTAITDRLEKDYVEPKTSVGIGPPSFDFYSIQASLPKYADMFYLNDYMKGYNSDNVEGKFSQQLANQYYQVLEPSNKPLQADGNDYLMYVFDMASFPDKIHRIEAVTTVANDYRVQTSMIYTMESRGGHDPNGKEKSWYDATYWRTAAQSEGNIKDGSNVRTISVDFGFQVASVMYGMDADFNYRGFKVRGEWVTNSTHYMFAEGTAGQGPPENIISGMPARTGHRWSERDHAYYLTMNKEWNMFGFSGEVFKMGKFYRPYFDYFYPAGTEVDWRYSIMTRNGMVRVPLIEDNDDDDMYPDTMAIRRTMGYNIYEQEDPDGVFPGNDEDNDGLPDNNRNNNNIPDYNEPFLMFDVDPDDFVFGNDYNNNMIPDFREDDMKFDTPYDLDRKGYHFFFRVSPVKRIDVVAGSMRQEGIGLSNRTHDDYLKAILNYDVFDIGKLYAEYRHERIQDNIRDPYVQVNQNMNEEFLMPGITATLGRFDRDLYFDELYYRNSRVNRLFLESKIRALPSITLENHVRYEHNNQLEGDMYDGTYQAEDTMETLAMVNKIVYTKQWGNFVFSPGMKFRFKKFARSESLQPLDHYLLRIPVVMFKYIISEKTDLSLGLQGFPGLPLQYTDYVQEQNDYEMRTYTLQLQNRTSYFGFDVWGAVGCTLEELSYSEDFRAFEEYKSSQTFVRVYLGW